MKQKERDFCLSEFAYGQLVMSKSGHDKGSCYLVIGIEKTFLLLADGRKRGIENPKRKNMRHVQKTHWVAADLNELLKKGKEIKNLEIRNCLNALKIEAKEG